MIRFYAVLFITLAVASSASAAVLTFDEAVASDRPALSQQVTEPDGRRAYPRADGRGRLDWDSTQDAQGQVTFDGPLGNIGGVTRVPQLDPSDGAAALSLLLGGLAVVLSGIRRHVRS